VDFPSRTGSRYPTRAYHCGCRWAADDRHYIARSYAAVTSSGSLSSRPGTQNVRAHRSGDSGRRDLRGNGLAATGGNSQSVAGHEVGGRTELIHCSTAVPTSTRWPEEPWSPSAASWVTVNVGKLTGLTPAHRMTSVPSLKVPIGTSTPSGLRIQA